LAPGPRPLRWAWLGRAHYKAVWELQEALRQRIQEGQADDTLLLCEHEPTITLGRSARREHVLASDAELARRGVSVVASSRGGDVTYHGPGQLVGYPVVRVRGALDHVQGMARAVAGAIAPLGVQAEWRRECPGLWVGPRKLCAFGVHIQRRVAIHGFALNVTTPLEMFSLIIPCGQASAGVTSLAALGAAPPALPELAARVAAAFGAGGAGAAHLEPVDPEALL
jgi:lipoate-protein ligase B